jgi:hypothetical protein
MLNYEVYFFPLMQYQKIIKNGNELYETIISFIKNIDPNTILWWNWELEENIIKKIKENTTNIIHCLFNWDHPFCLSEWDNTKNRKISSKNIWDICFVTGKSKFQDYLNSGSKECYYLRMFADNEVHFYEKDDKYKCDVSIVCTQFYDDKNIFPKTIVSREKILKDLIKENIDVRIYGPEHLKKKFPNNYHGFVHFLDNHKVFSNSKINLCTHVEDGYKYCNERVGTILSSGGLLFCDKVYGIDKILSDKNDCIFIEPGNHISQVKNILQNYDKYEHIKQNGLKKADENFSPKFWSEFIHKKISAYSKKYDTGKNLNQVNSFIDYKKDKISIVMTYFNRINQLKNTLQTIEESKYPKNLIEVICYDDGSEIEPLVLNLSKYSYNIKIIYCNKDKNKNIINPTHAYNDAFKYITGEYIIIQNSECMHIGDIISYTYENLKNCKNTLISFPCWATGNEKISNEVFQNRFNTNNLKNIINNKWRLLKNYPEELKGWYNEKMIRPECLHFCNALHTESFRKLGLFDTKFEKILGFDDNDYCKRALLYHNFNIIIPDHNYKLLSIHQYHGKYNKPRPYDLFKRSLLEYNIIKNYKINKFHKNELLKYNIIELDYNDINKNEFKINLSSKWSECMVFLKIKLHTNFDRKYIRECLKFSNFRIILN